MDQKACPSDQRAAQLMEKLDQLNEKVKESRDWKDKVISQCEKECARFESAHVKIEERARKLEKNIGALGAARGQNFEALEILKARGFNSCAQAQRAEWERPAS